MATNDSAPDTETLSHQRWTGLFYLALLALVLFALVWIITSTERELAVAVFGASIAMLALVIRRSDNTATVTIEAIILVCTFLASVYAQTMWALAVAFASAAAGLGLWRSLASAPAPGKTGSVS